MITSVEITPPQPDGDQTIWSVTYRNEQSQFETIKYGSPATVIGAITDIINLIASNAKTKNKNK